MTKKLQALSLLAFQLVIHFFMRMFWHPNGLEKFNKNFSDEGLFALSAGERRNFSDFERCVGCFLCDTACPERSIKFTPSHLILAVSRNLSSLPFLPPMDICIDSRMSSPCEAACPVQVPIRRVLDFVHSKTVNS